MGRIPKEEIIPKEKRTKETTEDERHCRKRKRRIVMIQRVDILRRKREKRTGDHRIDERGARFISGRVQMTGSMSTEPGS